MSVNYTDYHLIQELYMKNHEIATHTFNHVSNPGFEEIVAAKLWLNEVAHVPMNKIRVREGGSGGGCTVEAGGSATPQQQQRRQQREAAAARSSSSSEARCRPAPEHPLRAAARVQGFRAPFLVHNPEMRAVLAQNGFLYDSSIPEPFPTATSPSGSERLWPYTMDYGLPQRCDLGTGEAGGTLGHSSATGGGSAGGVGGEVACRQRAAFPKTLAQADSSDMDSSASA